MNFQNLSTRFQRFSSERDLRDDLPRVVALVAAIVFVDHVFDFGFMSIDWLGIGLLVLIGFAPYLSHLRKLALGEFEVELGSEIERVEKKQKSREQAEDDQESIEDDSEADHTESENGYHPRDQKMRKRLISRIDDSPSIAVSEVRSTIARYLNLIAEANGIDVDYQDDELLALRLMTTGNLDQSSGEFAVEVLDLCDDALKGPAVSPKDAEKIVELGVDVVSQLRTIYHRNIMDPIEQEVISREESQSYRDGKYRVKTVIPLLEEPKMVVRELDQAGINALLEGYHEFAEFIVDVEKIE